MQAVCVSPKALTPLSLHSLPLLLPPPSPPPSLSLSWRVFFLRERQKMVRGTKKDLGTHDTYGADNLVPRFSWLMGQEDVR